MKTILSLFISLIILANTAFAQDPCYEDKRSTGLKHLNSRDYREAIRSFRGALNCLDLPQNNDLDRLIDEAQEKWVKELETARDRALAAQKAEKEAKEEAIAAKRQAEENAQKAKEQGKKAESLLLFLHSDNALRKGENDKALLLSFLGLMLSGDEVTPSGRGSFFEAVRSTHVRELFRDTTSIRLVTLLPGGKKILTKTGSSVQLVDVAEEDKLKLPLVSRPSLNAASSHNGKYLVSWSDESKPELWNNLGKKMGELAGHEEPLRATAFSPNDQRLLTCSRDNTCRLWDLNGNPLATLTGHTGNIYEAAFSPNGERIVTRSADGTARLWNREGNSIAVLGQNEIYINDMAFSPDGKYVSTATAAGSAKTWSLNGNLETEFNHKEPVKEIRFPNNGEKLLSRGLETAKIWDFHGSLIATLKHPDHRLLGMNLNDEQNLILTWSDDNTARLWDTNGNLLQALTGHRDELISAEFYPGYEFFLTTSLDGTAKLWDTEGNILMDWDLETGDPLPAFSTPEGKYIIAVTDGREVLSVCPIPPEIYKNMKREINSLQDDFLKLQKEYNLQYLEEIIK